LNELNIYGTASCGKCNMLKMFCTENNINFNMVDVYEDNVGLEKLKEVGKTRLPVIEINGEWTEGLLPSKKKIKELINIKGEIENNEI